MKTLLLCAGLGERMLHMTKDKAKPSLNFLNVPLMSYPIYYLRQVGLLDLVINTHYKPESIHEAYKKIEKPKENVIFLHEDPEILLSGGAVKNSWPHLKDCKNFYYVNADSFFLCKNKKIIKDLLDFHNSQSAWASLLTTNYEPFQTTHGAVWFDKNNQLQTVGRNIKDKSLKSSHFTGVMILSTKIIEHIPCGASGIFTTLLKLAREKKPILNFYCKDMKWFEIGTPENFTSSENYCKNLLNVGSADAHFEFLCLQEILSSF